MLEAVKTQEELLEELVHAGVGPSPIMNYNFLALQYLAYCSCIYCPDQPYLLYRFIDRVHSIHGRGSLRGPRGSGLLRRGQR